MVNLVETAQEKNQIKTIALNLPTYLKLLAKKTELEMELGRVVSFDRVINKILEENHAKED